MRYIIGQRVDYNGAGFLRGQQYIHSKNWPKNSPTLIYQEIVPFQSEYKHSTIIWGIPLLNGFNGSVFLSELFGCHCFTNVRVVSFQTIWFLRGLGNRFTIAVMFGATSSTCLNMFLQPRNGIFQMPDPAGWVQGEWSYHSNLILNKLSVCLFCFVFSLTVKIILKSIVAIG